jgi:hypothetical protein
MHRTVYDRSGFIVSLPAPGRKHRIACIEIPSDRGLKRRIAEGEYEECFHWAEGEKRRWRIGRAGGAEEEGEEIVGGVSKEFRWRKWRGLEKELRIEMKKRNKLNQEDVNPVKDSGEPSAYSVSPVVSRADIQLLPGDSCHQCRRKSEKPKMKCRNVDPMCRAIFCESCCRR